MNHFNIQKANKIDLPEINQLLKAADLPLVDPEEFTNYFYKSTDQENKVNSAIGLEIYENYGLLRSMVVDPNYRNKGIAGILIDQVVKSATDIGLHEIYLLTSTAEKYFLKKGFEVKNREHCPAEIKGSKEYSSICPSSSSLMSKKISNQG